MPQTVPARLSEHAHACIGCRRPRIISSSIPQGLHAPPPPLSLTPSLYAGACTAMCHSLGDQMQPVCSFISLHQPIISLHQPIISRPELHLRSLCSSRSLFGLPSPHLSPRCPPTSPKVSTRRPRCLPTHTSPKVARCPPVAQGAHPSAKVPTRRPRCPPVG